MSPGLYKKPNFRASRYAHFYSLKRLSCNRAADNNSTAASIYKMKKKVLITGGADFIGSHVADELLQYGYQIRALDVLSPQVHGEQRRRPEYLDRDIELIQGDVRDFAVVERALIGIDAVYHFAAAVGGSGKPVSVIELADELVHLLEKPHIGKSVTGRYRKGDIRHCFADISLARSLLGYEPKVTLKAGLLGLAQWLEGQTAIDRFAQAHNELTIRGLAA
jgi:nucleoside-diphosphate-sugar epimerase